jgi:hypothetical protein
MIPRITLLVCCALFATSSIRAAAPAPGPVRLIVEPARIVLTHRDDRHRLLVSGIYADGSIRDRTRSAVFVPADAAIVSVKGGIVRPLKSGATTISVRDGNQTTSIAIEVTGIQPRSISFANDIMPTLSHAGCNAGACHGSASGKKGFKVSLRGYDPAADFANLTRGGSARRLDPLEPAHSLLILKPTGRVVHEGGKRFDADSDSARILTRWIAEGARSDLSTAPKLAGLEVSPSFRTFTEPGGAQQLLVRATFSDGSVRDVTDQARYASSNEMAVIPRDGLASLLEKGEAAITVRYGNLVTVSTLVVLRHDKDFRWNNPAENSYVDRYVFGKLRAMEVLPSELCEDGVFLRRVSYDVIGLPPTPEDIRAFVADRRPDKRAGKIDELLQRPEHADLWASKWADLFRLRFDLVGDKGTWGTYRWLRDSVANNKRFDRFVREIVTAEGSTERIAPANFWKVFATPDDAAEATAQVFLGIRLMCARCHDHPFEKWVQKDYYGLTAFFTQVSRKAGRKQGELVVFRQDTPAQSRHPITGEALSPKYLDGVSVPVDDKQDARTLLAEWMTRKDNPFLARATVNRLWAQLFGRGIIEPVDDIRSSNPPVNAPLLDALARDLIESGFNVRHILRVMLNSRTYQLSARTNRFNAEDHTCFSHAMPRRLTAEQLLDTLGQITGVRENFRSRIPGQPTVALPVGGLRAVQLPDRMLTAELLDLFGRPRGESTCACERNEEASLTQALHLINGQAITSRIADPNGKLARLVRTPGLTDDRLIEELFLQILCRFPSATEQILVRKHLTGAKDREAAAQDIVWTLLNARSFLFNH